MTVPALLGAATGYAFATDSGSAPCTRCTKAIDFRVRNGSVEIGFTYWAGSFHFEPIQAVRVSRLRQRQAEDAVTFELPGFSVTVPLFR